MSKGTSDKNWFVRHKILTGILVLVVLIIGISSVNGSGDKADNKSNTDSSQKAPAEQASAQKEDLSKVAKEYTLTAGYYTAGVDLPAGTTDVAPVSGTGNLSSSNLYNGGVNEMFGVDDGSGMYTSEFKGLKFPKNTKLSLNDKLQVKLTFTSIDFGFTGRTYDDSAAKEFGSGNYTAGKDFKAGTYKIDAVSGSGNLSSSNLYNGGVNEMFGVDDGSGMYNGQFLNAEFSNNTTVTVSGGLTIKLTPAK